MTPKPGLSGPWAYDRRLPVIPNGVDVPAKTDLRLPVPSWHGGDNRRLMLFLGRLHPKKGISDLLEAWHFLVCRNPKMARRWRLAVAGWDDGGHEQDLRSKASALNLKEHVVFTGPLFGKDKQAALQHASGYVLPSHSEGLPMSVLEAWAYGLPVFMTDACNLGSAFGERAACRISSDPNEMAAVFGGAR